MSGLLASLLMAVGLMKVYVEDVFSAYTYTGNGGAQTLVTGQDLAGKGGMCWFKSRSDTKTHQLVDTARGIGNALSSAATSAQQSVTGDLTSFNSNGITLGTPTSTSNFNTSAVSMALWTFLKAPKFFDFGTYTGNGTSGRQISHALGQTPGMVILKRTDTGGDVWIVHHRSLGTGQIYLNLTSAGDGGGDITATSSTTFTVANFSGCNQSGASYVWYAFAHDTGTDGLIQCSTYTGTGAANKNITLNFEPQFVIVKRTDSTSSWVMHDMSRGMSDTAYAQLLANDSAAENASTGAIIYPTATGFRIDTTGASYNASGGTYIYMAIRAPMKVPTDATKVFNIVNTPSASTITVGRSTIGFSPDVILRVDRNAASSGAYCNYLASRLRGFVQGTANGTDSPALLTHSTAAETTSSYIRENSGDISYGGAWTGYGLLGYFFKRAPGFMQEVCYTGTGSAKTEAHGLGVAPELWISKSRSATNRWVIGCSYLPTPASDFLELSTSTKGNDTTTWNNTVPTASVFSVGTGTDANSSGVTYDMLLFATCPGVSKVGGYIGTGTTLQIDCGFAAGARFVLIKRTTVATGDWYLWDSVRGIVSGNDPYLLLNSTAAEVTSTDYIDPYSAGFEISSSAPAAINASGGTFIFLAIA